jgi:hypothetical protein
MATPMPAACSAGAVVDSVAGNRDDLSLPAQAFHDRRFLQRLGAGEHPRLRHHRVELRAVPPGEIGVPWKGAGQSAFSLWDLFRPPSCLDIRVDPWRTGAAVLHLPKPQELRPTGYALPGEHRDHP